VGCPIFNILTRKLSKESHKVLVQFPRHSIFVYSVGGEERKIGAYGG
jgi:hypothetical protein